MRHHLFAGLAAVLIAAGLVVAAPTASAGCLYDGGLSSSRCDGTVQPDGTWQRCVTWQFAQYRLRLPSPTALRSDGP